MEYYSTKQFIEMVGVKFSTLRFYERIQLLDPQKNPVNNYRTYTLQDAFVIIKFKRLQSFGFSTKEAVQIIREKDERALSDFAAAQIGELKKQRIINEYRISTLKKIQKIFSSPVTLLDYSLSKEEDILFLPASQSHDFTISSYEKLNSWGELSPLTRFCRILQLSAEGEDTGEEPDFGIAIPAKHASLLEKKDREGSRLLRNGECLRFFSKNLGYPEISRDIIEKALHHAREIGYTPRGSIYFEGLDLRIGDEALQLILIPLAKSS